MEWFPPIFVPSEPGLSHLHATSCPWWWWWSGNRCNNTSLGQPGVEYWHFCNSLHHKCFQYYNCCFLVIIQNLKSGYSKFKPKGWKLKKVWFSFYPWCAQSELSLVKHGQKAEILRFSKLFLFLIFEHV